MDKVLIIDTNLVFSALLSSSSYIRDTLLENHFNFYAPNYIVSELFKHKEKMLKYSKLSESDFYTYFNGIVENIKFTPLEIISLESRQKAYDLCKDVDLKDIPFIALAIELNAPFWTSDKKLKRALIPKGFVLFYEQPE